MQNENIILFNSQVHTTIDGSQSQKVYTSEEFVAMLQGKFLCVKSYLDSTEGLRQSRIMDFDEIRVEMMSALTACSNTFEKRMNIYLDQVYLLNPIFF